jgi:ArsR family transcriptional regulator
MKEFIRVMKALSDPGRVKIIKMLGEKELCVCETTAILNLAQPTVSKHLKILEDAGLVTSWKEGSWVNYRLASAEESNKYAQTMLSHLKDWLNDDKQVLDLLAKAPQIDRERINVA